MPITWIIGGIVGVVMLVGAGLFKHGYDESKIEEGRTECRQAIAEANDKATKAAGELKDEAASHISDLELADRLLSEKAAARVVYVTKKGASDVAAHPEVFKNAACTLPPDALRNLNAARAGLRRDPPADVVRVDVGASPGATAGPPANPAGAPAGVRGARPLGKRQP